MNITWKKKKDRKKLSIFRIVLILQGLFIAGNPIWTTLEQNPGFVPEKSQTNHTNNGMAHTWRFDHVSLVPCKLTSGDVSQPKGNTFYTSEILDSARDPLPCVFHAFLKVFQGKWRGKCLNRIRVASAHTRWAHINVARRWWWWKVSCRVFRFFPRPYHLTNTSHALPASLNKTRQITGLG